MEFMLLMFPFTLRIIIYLMTYLETMDTFSSKLGCIIRNMRFLLGNKRKKLVNFSITFSTCISTQMVMFLFRIMLLPFQIRESNVTSSLLNINKVFFLGCLDNNCKLFLLTRAEFSLH